MKKIAILAILLVFGMLLFSVYAYQHGSPLQNGRITFVSGRDGNYEVYTMNPDGSNQLDLTNNPANDTFPDWSLDGLRIVFSSDRDTNGQYQSLYVMNADGSNVQRRTYNTPDFAPDWSPDGTKIVFQSTRDRDMEIYVMNADGTNQQRLTFSLGDDFAPGWSPDGTKIVFQSNRDGNYEIYVMNADGSNVQRRTYNPSDDMSPAWSPDMSSIMFASNRDGNYEIYVMNADGSNVQRRTYNLEDDYAPDAVSLGTPTLLQDGSNFCSLRGHAMTGAPFVMGSNPNASWVDATGSLGLSGIIANGASLSDVNNDGFPDLFVVGEVEPINAELYINCVETFYPVDLAAVTTMGGSEVIRGTASYTVDVDQDGFVDLLTAGAGGTTQVFYGRGYLTYELMTVANEVPIPDAIATNIAAVDLNQDTRLDLYITNKNTPNVIPFPGCCFNTGPNNTVMLQQADGSFQDVTSDLETILESGRRHTFAFIYPSRRFFDLDPLFFIGNDFGYDYMHPHYSRSADPLSFGSSIEFPFDVPTMGADYNYKDDSLGNILLYRSNWGGTIIFEVTPENGLIEISSAIPLDMFGAEFVGWGIQAIDGDNRGEVGFVLANGYPDILRPGSSIVDQHLQYFQEEGSVDMSPTAGPDFDGTVTADVAGVYSFDYDRDGCLDLAVTGTEFFREYIRQFSGDPELVVPVTPLRVLRNTCSYPGSWVGLKLPDDISAMIRLRYTDLDGVSHNKYMEIKSSSSIGGRNDGSTLHFGLGNIVDRIDGVTVAWSDGTTADYAVEINRYNTISRP